jgi:hypothetical protein
MGYKEFPYSTEQKGWGLLVTVPGTLIGIFETEEAAQTEGNARRKAKAYNNPRVVEWTEAEYNKALTVFDIHFLWSDNRRSVPVDGYRDPNGKSFDTYPTPDLTKKQFTGVKFYTDIRSIIADGRGKAHLRQELKDHPANQLEIPETIPVYTAKNNWADEDYKRYQAFMRVNGQDIVICSSVTRNKLFDDLHFAVVYSMYSPSLYYRAFRTAYGFEQFSNDYGTPELRKEGDRRVFGAMAVMAGASNESIQNIMKVSE